MSQPSPAAIAKWKKVATTPIPAERIKVLDKGFGKPLSYISGTTCIDLLNEAFDYMWDWVDDEHWMTDSVPKFNKKLNKFEEQGPTAHVKGCLIVYLPDINGEMFAIRKTGMGTQSVFGGQSEQENVWKSASTDAMKKAATKLGIGLELARSEEEQSYFDMQNYENPWTDELLKKHAGDIEFVQNFATTNNLSAEEINQLISEFSCSSIASFDDILPEVLPGFIAWLKETSAPAEKEAI